MKEVKGKSACALGGIWVTVAALKSRGLANQKPTLTLPQASKLRGLSYWLSDVGPRLRMQDSRQVQARWADS